MILNNKIHKIEYSRNHSFFNEFIKFWIYESLCHKIIIKYILTESVFRQLNCSNLRNKLL